MNEGKIIDCSLCMFCSKTISAKHNEYFCGLPGIYPDEFFGKVTADKKQWRTEYDGMKLRATDMYVQNVRECPSFYSKKSIMDKYQTHQPGLIVKDITKPINHTPFIYNPEYDIKQKKKEHNYRILPYPIRQIFIDIDNRLESEISTLVVNEDDTIKRIIDKRNKSNPIRIIHFLMTFMYAGILYHLIRSYDPESFTHIAGIFVSLIGFVMFISLFINTFKKSK